MDATLALERSEGLYHLEARAPFHFGLRGVGIEATAAHGPSDTLFSALCHVLRQQAGREALDAFLAGFADAEPPLLLSSAFPYVLRRTEQQIEQWQPADPFDPAAAVRFFPRPMEPPPGAPDDPENRKTIKRIAWVSEGIFRAWVGGESLSKPYATGLLVQGGRVWLSAEEASHVAGWLDEEQEKVRLWMVGDVPRVTVDRRASTSAVFQAGRVWYQRHGGLWLLARWRADWRERGETALRVLGDAGLGGERSAGHGLFDLRGPHTLEGLPAIRPGGRFVCLSLYHPAPGDLPGVLEGDVHYALRLRRGWMASPDAAGVPNLSGMALRRKAVRMLAEGSILQWPGQAAAAGDLIDVTPEVFRAHRVWRYGLAWPVGYRPEGGGR